MSDEVTVTVLLLPACCWDYEMSRLSVGAWQPTEAVPIPSKMLTPSPGVSMDMCSIGGSACAHVHDVLTVRARGDQHWAHAHDNCSEQLVSSVVVCVTDFMLVFMRTVGKWRRTVLTRILFSTTQVVALKVELSKWGALVQANSQAKGNKFPHLLFALATDHRPIPVVRKVPSPFLQKTPATIARLVACYWTQYWAVP